LVTINIMVFEVRNSITCHGSQSSLRGPEMDVPGRVQGSLP
jgi:hypothetical protein